MTNSQDYLVLFFYLKSILLLFARPAQLGTMSKSHLMLFGEFLELSVVLCIYGEAVQDVTGL